MGCKARLRLVAGHFFRFAVIDDDYPMVVLRLGKMLVKHLPRISGAETSRGGPGSNPSLKFRQAIFQPHVFSLDSLDDIRNVSLEKNTEVL
mmetsp:Transcript_52924/g.114459  ORF Transcript_52924/g.114459 Transcript_52924/m.114459 type:complete len:91 (+) Transcript_52924:351-623(+)